MYQHFIHNRGAFDHTSVRRQIPLKDCQPSCSRIRMVNRTNDLWITVHRSFYIFSYRLSCNSHTICMEKVFLIQFGHNRIDASRLI